jgi:hypothetical protein
MSEWERYVYDLYHEIQAMPHRERRKLWDLLRGAFPLALEGTDPTPAELWDYLENRFGKKEVRLLRFLCERGIAREVAVIKFAHGPESVLGLLPHTAWTNAAVTRLTL